jgi:predicted TIM-barrel fold metal-dependent hydrolase
MITRREFLGTSLGTPAAATALPALLEGVLATPAALAGTADGANAAPGGTRVLVDWHSHFFTNAELRALSARKQPPRITLDEKGTPWLENVTTVSFAAGKPSVYSPSDVQARLQHLDAHGIEKQLLTQTVALGLDATLPLDELKPLFRAFNDELAGVVHKYPNRFLGVAALPSGDPVWAAEELRRGHRELGFIGGSLPLNAFATLEGARTLAPLFAEAQKHGSHFFIHRGPASDRVPGQPPLVVPADTDQPRWGLISNAHLTAGGITLGLTDFLDPYPDVTVEIVMLAGFTPYLVDSWVDAGRSHGESDPLARLRRIYLDTGPYSRNGEWVALAATKLGADRILFGTDYGVGGGTRGDVGPGIASLDKALTPAQRQAIYIDNSRRILQGKGRA